jgi:hypothetical protein
MNGYVFTLGSSSMIALSSIEAKYRCFTDGAKEATWLQRLGKEIGFFGTQATLLMCDNQSSVELAKNLVFHTRTKHIEIQYHFIT